MRVMRERQDRLEVKIDKISENVTKLIAAEEHRTDQSRATAARWAAVVGGLVTMIGAFVQYALYSGFVK